MERKASAVWSGGLKDGKGAVSTSSGALKEVPYNFSMRFENAPGTNPEELVAAAHAGCFSMALSGQLGAANLKAERIATTATVTLEHLAAGWTIMNIHLNVVARLSRLTQGEFIDATVRAKTSCLVSRLMRVNISMNAKLEN